jgi:hypothetical protein
LPTSSGLEVSDDEVKALVREQAEAAGEDADNVIEDLWNHGRQEDLREDLSCAQRSTVWRPR